jgi:sugar phosphate isomerase/epimerase
MPAPIALQLYSLREAIAQTSYDQVVRQVAEIGYPGIETAGFPGTDPQSAGKLFKELGLTVCSIHSFPVPGPEKKGEILDTLGALDCQRLVSGGGPDQFKTQADIQRISEQLNAASAMLSPHGVSIGVHNHWWEYLKVGERYAYEILLENLAPGVFFQIDTYWVKTAGVDPAQVVGRLGKRAPLLHIKDGPATQGQPMVAVGAGVMDIPAIVAAAGGATEWMIVELDACATDMLTAVRDSYTYLTGNALAQGKR